MIVHFIFSTLWKISGKLIGKGWLPGMSAVQLSSLPDDATHSLSFVPTEEQPLGQQPLLPRCYIIGGEYVRDFANKELHFLKQAQPLSTLTRESKSKHPGETATPDTRPRPTTAIEWKQAAEEHRFWMTLADALDAYRGEIVGRIGSFRSCREPQVWEETMPQCLDPEDCKQRHKLSPSVRRLISSWSAGVKECARRHHKIAVDVVCARRDKPTQRTGHSEHKERERFSIVDPMKSVEPKIKHGTCPDVAVHAIGTIRDLLLPPEASALSVTQFHFIVFTTPVFRAVTNWN